MLGNPLASQELGSLVGEVVAVVLEQVIPDGSQLREARVGNVYLSPLNLSLPWACRYSRNRSGPNSVSPS